MRCGAKFGASAGNFAGPRHGPQHVASITIQPSEVIVLPVIIAVTAAQPIQLKQLTVRIPFSWKIGLLVAAAGGLTGLLAHWM
jgi:hypothetical protein